MIKKMIIIVSVGMWFVVGFVSVVCLLAHEVEFENGSLELQFRSVVAETQVASGIVIESPLVTSSPALDEEKELLKQQLRNFELRIEILELEMKKLRHRPSFDDEVIGGKV